MATDLLIDRRGTLIFVTLNRPEALNALNFPIIRGLSAVLDQAEQDPSVVGIVLRGAGDRAFCAGGDIKAAREGGLAWKRGEASLDETLAFFDDEYALNRRLFHFPKLLIALMDGITMGGGVGVAGPCRIKIATEKTRWAMPEVTIGFFPDVGAGYYLTRAPGQIGRYLGLTGQHLDTAFDLLSCGFATHCVPHDDIERMIISFNAAHSAEEIEEIIATFHQAPSGMSTLDRNLIDTHFSHETVPEIYASLDGGREEAQKIAALMRTKSPTSLTVTLRHLQLSRTESFDEVSNRDFKLADVFLRGHDLYEGIRAAVVDKDRNPKWAPEEGLGAYF